MLIKIFKITFLSALLIIACKTILPAKSVYDKTVGNGEIEIKLAPYDTNIDYYIPLTHSPIPCLDENNELEVYKRLILSPLPRFLVAEASVNPAASLGVFIRKNDPDFYNRAYITHNFNIIQAGTAGFNEPWAGSLFLGNVMSYSPPGLKQCSGKGYFGALVSAGNLHIEDNQLVDDHWQQAELKIQGDKITADNKITWNFRLGGKFHENPFIKDTYYFSLMRDRIDFTIFNISLLKNSSIEYSFDIENDSGKIIRQYFKVGKKIPLGRLRAAVSMNIGFIWEGADLYTGPLARPGNGSMFQIILQPNLQF